MCSSNIENGKNKQTQTLSVARTSTEREEMRPQETDHTHARTHALPFALSGTGSRSGLSGKCMLETVLPAT